MATGIRRVRRRDWFRVAVLGLASFAALIPLIYGFERYLLSIGGPRNTVRRGEPRPFAQIEGEGRVRPPISGAEGSGMLDDDEVLGVEVGGRARAYRLAALRGRTNHVVNDMLGGVPVSVAYCDMTECARAYTDPLGSAPLGLSVGGIYVDNGPEMVVKLDGSFYLHKSGRAIQPGQGPAKLPLDSFEPIRTTWREWVLRHPETDVFVGDRAGDLK